MVMVACTDYPPTSREISQSSHTHLVRMLWLHAVETNTKQEKISGMVVSGDLEWKYYLTCTVYCEKQLASTRK